MSEQQQQTNALVADLKGKLNIRDVSNNNNKTGTSSSSNPNQEQPRRRNNKPRKTKQQQQQKQKQLGKEGRNDSNQQPGKKFGNGKAQEKHRRKNHHSSKRKNKRDDDNDDDDAGKEGLVERSSGNAGGTNLSDHGELSASATPFVPGGGNGFSLRKEASVEEGEEKNGADVKKSRGGRSNRVGGKDSTLSSNDQQKKSKRAEQKSKSQKKDGTSNPDKKNSQKSKDRKKDKDVASQKKDNQKDKGLHENKQKTSKSNRSGEMKHSKPKEKTSSSKSGERSPFTSSSEKAPNQPQTTNDLNYGKGSKIVVLHVAEKPSIAQSIAKGLCSNGAKAVGKSLPVHEFSGVKFSKAPNASVVVHKVTSVAGHVFSVDFPNQYQSWDSTDPLELFTAPIVQKPCKGSIVKHLQSEAKNVDFIVLWLDCDREGENIGFEVLQCTMHLMKDGGSSHYDRVYRAYFSAINPSDIQKAYNALGKPDRNQSLSVDARQELDLKVGVAFSRFQTRYFQGRYGDLDSAVLSYGPCQTPTLGFVVQRHVEIETFIPEPYWLLDLTVFKAGRSCKATWGGGRSFNKGRIEQYLKKVSESERPSAKVLSVVSKEKKQGRPTPLNTVGMLKACSKALGIGPHAALQTAERLYLQGFLSYPRTESTKYPASFDVNSALRTQSNDRHWGSYVRDLLKDGGAKKPKGGIDMGDHPPITPCRASDGYLSGDMARVYDLVTRHFIASVSHDAVWQSTRVELALEELGEKGTFSIAAKEMVSPGFLAVMLHKQYGDDRETDGLREEEDEDEKQLPKFTKDEMIPVVVGKTSSRSISSNVSVAEAVTSSRASLQLKELMTTKPSYLSESELISKMEKNCIGTDASISTHIENILKRNYAELITGRKLAPTKLGLVLCQGYHLIDSSLVLPKIRSDIENQCNRIAKGQADKDTVLNYAIDIFQTKFENFVKNVDKMDVLFSSSFSKLAEVGKPFTRCGLSRRYLQLIEGPPARLYNKYTESVYPLPVGGSVKQWNESRCPACSFELSLYTVGSPPVVYPLCPYCFNNPRNEWGPLIDGGKSLSKDKVDAEDEKKEMKHQRIGGRSMTLECPLQDGHPLIESLTVSPDPDSGGVFIFQSTSKSKFKLVSTRAPTTIHLPQCIEKFAVTSEKEESLNCYKVKVTFKDGESPFDDGTKTYTTCFAEDLTLQKMSRIFTGSDRQKVQRGGRGGGRGRGSGGGRGRGRGRGGRGRGRR